MVSVEIERVEQDCSSPLRFHAKLFEHEYSKKQPATLHLSMIWDGESPVITENNPISQYTTIFSESSELVLLRTNNQCERDRKTEKHGVWKVDPTSNFPTQDLGTHFDQLQPGEEIERIYEIWQSQTSDRLALNSRYEFELRIGLGKAEWCVFRLILSLLDDRSNEVSNRGT